MTADRRAERARYAKRRVYERAHGKAYSHPAIGTQRRIRALAVMGWSAAQIAESAGWPNSRNVADLLKASKRVVWAPTHDRICDVYNRLSMQKGPSQVTRSRALAKGWQPPLAWDDQTIDDPHAQPCNPDDTEHLDEVLIQRGISGQPVDANRRERAQIIRQWRAAGRSLNELDHIQGWNSHRDLRLEGAA